MKKTLVILSMMVSFAAAAQEMTSKKGTPILPEKGDWGIGIKSNSILEYFGNVMTNEKNTSPTFDFLGDDQEITGKMFKDANTAYRGKLRILYKRTSTNAELKDDAPQGSVSSTSNTQAKIGLGGGLQKYRGKGRLRGYYGGEGGILYDAGSTTKYDFKGSANEFAELKNRGARSFTLSINGFIGVEYFFAPKMSVSGEFGWGPEFEFEGRGKKFYKGKDDEFSGNRSATIDFDTRNSSGAINLNFYF